MRLPTILAIFGATCAIALLEDTGPSVAKMGLCLRKCGSDLDCETYCLTVSNLYNAWILTQDYANKVVRMG
ncbi:hypothetical protein N7481_006059 [Penicillium waksmanii]|uniref:uncharacterized protein n=1 Tax=Penicillium waksmanii TaxID=69791 RepID=UPI0025486D79|nr:uncharacterized protein N7481_006059 [Penicillium waksmanii]KAJ5983960.1 hypothetical protein N7481_006059 [Penicillium waksmanii]